MGSRTWQIDLGHVHSCGWSRLISNYQGVLIWMMIDVFISGADTGNVIAMIFGGIVATHWSWEWIFYLTGLLTILWTVLWFFVVYESPSTHPTITSEELIYIQSNIDRSAIRVNLLSYWSKTHLFYVKNDSIPWKAIFTSLPVWAIVAAHFGANWIIYLSLTELPTFLALALDYPVAQVRQHWEASSMDDVDVLFSQGHSLPYLGWLPLWLVVLAVFSLTSSEKAGRPFLFENPSLPQVREMHSFVCCWPGTISLVLASIGTSLSMLLLTLLPADQRTWILISICLAMASCGLSAATFSVNHLDIGGRYGGLLMALSNCFASIAGILIPTLTGHIVLDDHVRNSLLLLHSK